MLTRSLASPALSCAVIALKVAPDKNADGSVDVTVTTDKLALYVTLTSLAQGYFSENTCVVSAFVTAACIYSYA